MIVQLDIFNDAPRQDACKACGKPCGKQSTCSAKCRDAYGQLCARDKAFKKRPQLKCVPCLYKVGFGCKSAARVLFIPPIACSSQARRLGLKANSTAARVRFLENNKKYCGPVAQINQAIKRAMSVSKRLFFVSSSKVKSKQETAEQYRRRYKIDPQFAAKERVRQRVNKMIARRNTFKRGRTLDLVGCSASELARHIESQFLPGMNWENRGLWHIDHIKPCAMFDLSTEAGQRECFHYTNMRPLWADENNAKSSVYGGVRYRITKSRVPIGRLQSRG